MDLAPVISLETCGGAIFAGTEENGLYISKDNGDTWLQLAPDTIQGTVIQVFVDDAGILAVLEDGVHFSADGGKSWQARFEFGGDFAIASITAPLGVGAQKPLWVGLSNGEIRKI
jgi:hypothetical protein